MNEPFKTVGEIPLEARAELEQKFFNLWKELNAEANSASKDFAKYLFLVHGGGAVALIGFIQVDVASRALQRVAMGTLACFLLGLIVTGLLLFARGLSTTMAAIDADNRRKLMRRAEVELSVVMALPSLNKWQRKMARSMKLSYGLAVIGLVVGFFGPAFSLIGGW